METVILKNGEEVAASLVRILMISLDKLFTEKPITFYEAVMCARDSQHVPFGKTGDELRSLSILQPDGKMHNAVRSVLLSAFVGDGFDLELVSPV